jgi:hypothetical protein
MDANLTELACFVGTAMDNFCRFADRSDIVAHGPYLEKALRDYGICVQARLADAQAYREKVIAIINIVHARSRRRTF